jgi:histone H2A
LTAAVLEYLAAELMEIAGNCAKDCKKQRIIPRHILLAVRNDEELNKLFKNVTIPSGGVIPNIHSVLLPKRSKAALALAEKSPKKESKKAKSPGKSPKKTARKSQAVEEDTEPQENEADKTA